MNSNVWLKSMFKLRKPSNKSPTHQKQWVNHCSKMVPHCCNLTSIGFQHIFESKNSWHIVPTYSKLTVPRFPSNTTHRTIKSAKKLWLILPSQLQRNEDWNKKNAAVLAAFATHGASGFCRGNFCVSRAVESRMDKLWPVSSCKILLESIPCVADCVADCVGVSWRCKLFMTSRKVLHVCLVRGCLVQGVSLGIFLSWTCSGAALKQNQQVVIPEANWCSSSKCLSKILLCQCETWNLEARTADTSSLVVVAQGFLDWDQHGRYQGHLNIIETNRQTLHFNPKS